MKFKVEISPSVFREHERFTLGLYRSFWTARLASFWYVIRHPHAAAEIYEKIG